MATPGNIDFVIYHNNCRDGTASAFCVQRYRDKNDIKESCRAMPLNYNVSDELFDRVLEEVEGTNLLICDYSFNWRRTEQLLKVVKSLMVIDHHKTAEKELANLPNHQKIFDMNHSGAVLTWKWFFPDEPVPRLFQLIEDRDIWGKKYPETDTFSMAFFTMPNTFETYYILLRKEEIDKVISTGEKYLEYQEILIDGMLEHAQIYFQYINGKVYRVGYIESSLFMSDLGNKMMREIDGLDFAVVYYHTSSGTKFSLRSLDETADVSKVAKLLGGGGHRNASGCYVKKITNILPFDVIVRNPSTDLQNVSVSWGRLRDLSRLYLPLWIHSLFF